VPSLTSPRLNRSFYARDPVTLARDLLGRILFYRTPAGLLAGRLVEVEAYTGQQDPASHAFRGLTNRNAVMFGPAGFAYVYFTYGMHHCLNVTAQEPGRAGAVLIRALEPLRGIELMRAHGDSGPQARLLSGPGKIGRAFGLTLRDNGRDLTRGPLGIAAGTPLSDDEVLVGPRVGITRAVELPYLRTASRPAPVGQPAARRGQAQREG
jgi:DNA-3-methyladenine glycosylase